MDSCVFVCSYFPRGSAAIIACILFHVYKGEPHPGTCVAAQLVTCVKSMMQFCFTRTAEFCLCVLNCKYK